MQFRGLGPRGQTIRYKCGPWTTAVRKSVYHGISRWCRGSRGPNVSANSAWEAPMTIPTISGSTERGTSASVCGPTLPSVPVVVHPFRSRTNFDTIEPTANEHSPPAEPERAEVGGGIDHARSCEVVCECRDPMEPWCMDLRVPSGWTQYATACTHEIPRFCHSPLIQTSPPVECFECHPMWPNPHHSRIRISAKHPALPEPISDAPANLGPTFADGSTCPHVEPVHRPTVLAGGSYGHAFHTSSFHGGHHGGKVLRTPASARPRIAFSCLPQKSENKR